MMLINFSDLTSELKLQLQNELKERLQRISSANLETLIRVEYLTYTFLSNYEYKQTKATIENIWSVLTNHRHAFPPGKDDTRLDVIRYYFSQELTLPSWRQLVEQYLTLPSELRIYHLSEKGYFYQKSTGVCGNRHEEYERWLIASNLHQEGSIDPVFLDKEDRGYYFTDYVQGESVKLFPITLNNEKRFPSHLIENSADLIHKRQVWKLPSGRKKIERDKLAVLLEGQPWMDTAKAINDYLYMNRKNFHEADKKQIRDWMEAQALFQLKSTGIKRKNYLVYKDQVGIAGLVGAGKTTFLMMEIFRLTKLGTKSGIITVNVVDSLMLVYRLYLLGIKAVPLIGRKGVKRHLKDFLRKVKNETRRSFQVNPLSQLAVEYVLQFFEGECLANVLANHGSSQQTPCTSIRMEGEEQQSSSYACPLFTKCGKYTAERLLRNADVWVGTLSAYIHSKPLRLVNPFNRTYAELAHDELDVIFVDEADSVQETADAAFIAENKLFGEDDAIFEKGFLKVSHQLHTRYDISHSKTAQLWIHHSNEANRVIHLIFELIHEHEIIRSKIKNRTFGIHKIMSDITKAFFQVQAGEVSRHPFFHLLNGIDLSSLRHSEGNKGAVMERAIQDFVNRMTELKRYDNYDYLTLKQEERGETKKLLQLFQRRVDSSLERVKNTKEKEEDALLLFRFFIYHLYFDYNFKALLGWKSSVEVLSNQKIEDISVSYYHLKRYLPLLPESATGRNFQYFYKESSKTGSVGTFRTYDYLAIGRHFLTDMGTLFEKLKGTQGPAMCYMSGSSFAEGSLHFHVDVPLDYLLYSTSKKRSKIDQFLYPVFMNGSPIYISGEPNEEIKKVKLKRMAQELVPKIKEELTILKEEERKVLLVVNSYEQALLVQQELVKYFPGKVFALSKKTERGRDISQILRSEVEFFADIGADILIVPLLSINRGYNVLKKGSSISLFGSIFFLIRPYIPGDSIENMIKLVNGSVPYYIKEARKRGYEFYEVVKYVRKRSNAFLEHLLLEDAEWTYLDEMDRRAMAWYMFVNVWQMIGRLLRGQSDARVFYVDAPFANEYANNTGKKETVRSSMIRAWLSILESESSNDEAKNELYGEFIRGLRELVK
ncbi:hypothetical protein V7139_23585 [Neobacillus drentensis]|uniref:pPIWI_RE_Z domain-containing protein n=1 Tax=Neobacillus drentensis TaxID=220684 RepID=UPI00300259EB